MPAKKTVKKTATKKKAVTRKPSVAKLQKQLSQLEKKFFDYRGMWSPIGSAGTGYGGTYDAFDSLPSPSPVDLVLAFTNEAYSCSTFIAESLADIEIKLCAETKSDQQDPRVRHTQIAGKGLKWYQKKAARLHEIHEHETLDLLACPNKNMTWADLIKATDLYLEIVGRAFWYLKTDEIANLPISLHVLPAHLITTVRDEDTNELLGYRMGDEKSGTFFEPDKVLAFRNYEYFDLEHGEGISPLRAVWQEFQLTNKELSSWEIIVTQMAQPLVMLSPKDPEINISEANAERIAKEFTSRFFQAGKGGVYVNSEAMDMNPISWPPKDQAGLALQDNLKSKICNAFKLPRALLDMQDVAQANGNNSITLFQRHCLKPRINYILEKINAGIVRKFDDRLFLVAENVIAKDEALEVQKQTLYLSAFQAQGIMKNEFRALLGLDPVSDGNSFAAPAGPGINPLHFIGQDDNKKIKSFDPAKKYEQYPIRPVVNVLQKWFGIQKDYVMGKVKSYDTKAANWIDLGSFTNDMAEDLYPAFKAYYDEAGKKLVKRLGLTDDVWEVVQPKINEGVRAAVYEFAESTNKTTTLDLEEARRRLREELAEGLVAGETAQTLTERVQGIFENATEERAWLIADTERTRAISTAENMTARESGVVAKKVWLADGMACPICKSLDGTSRDLDEPFFVDPARGAYAVCQTPPGHPGCRCSQTYQLSN